MTNDEQYRQGYDRGLRDVEELEGLALQRAYQRCVELRDSSPYARGYLKATRLEVARRIAEAS